MYVCVCVCVYVCVCVCIHQTVSPPFQVSLFLLSSSKIAQGEKQRRKRQTDYLIITAAIIMLAVDSFTFPYSFVPRVHYQDYFHSGKTPPCHPGQWSLGFSGMFGY